MSVIIYYIYLYHKQKQNIMTTLENLIGKTDKEIQALYLSAIDVLIEFGMQEPEARKTVRELFKETLGLV